MTDAAKSLESLKSFVERAAYTNVVVAADASEGQMPIIQKLTLDESVAKEFRAVADSTVAKLAGGLRPFDPGYKLDPHETFWVDLKDLQEIKAIVDRLGDVDAAEKFKEKEEVVEQLRFYTIVVEDAKRTALFLRSYSPKKELTQRRGFALMLQGGAYNLVTERVFLFDEAVDCIAWDGIMYVLNVVQFQRMFRYFEALREKAEHALETVSKRIPIANLDEFRAACFGNSLMLSKLVALEGKPYLNRLTMGDVKRAISEFKLQIKTTNVGRKESLLFERAPDQRWLILKLLDDDFLGSIMTREKYEVNSKLRR